MKIKRLDLLGALNRVRPGLASKEIIEQSNCFVFTGDYVATYNDEVAISTPFETKFTGAVKSTEVSALLNKVKVEEINATIAEGELLITGGKFRSGIRIEEEVTLPLDFLDVELEFIAIPEGMLEGLKICGMSTAKESFIPLLSNIHVKGKFVESCDNDRATRYTMKENIDDELLIPAHSASYISSREIDGYSVGDGWIHFQETGTGMIYSCRTYNEEYPPLGDVLKVKGTPVRLPGELSDVLERSSIFSKNHAGTENNVFIQINNESILVRGENDNGWFEEEAEAQLRNDNEYSFFVNPHMLQEIIQKSSRVMLAEGALKFICRGFDHVIILDAEEE